MKKFTTKEKRTLTLSGSAGTAWAEAWAGMAWDGDDVGWEMREMRAWRGEI